MSMMAVLAVALTIVTVIPAYAEHNSAPGAANGQELTPSPTSPSRVGSLDIDLKVGLNGFRFGSRFFDRDGYAGGAWLNGETRPDGLSLEGRLERDGEARNFRMNVDIDEVFRRAARSFGLTDL